VETILWWQDRCWRGIDAGAEAGNPAMARLRASGAVRSVRAAYDWSSSTGPGSKQPWPGSTAEQVPGGRWPACRLVNGPAPFTLQPQFALNSGIIAGEPLRCALVFTSSTLEFRGTAGKLGKGEDKDAIAHKYLAAFDGKEGVLFVGHAQEKAWVFRTQKRRNPRTAEGRLHRQPAPAERPENQPRPRRRRRRGHRHHQSRRHAFRYPRPGPALHRRARPGPALSPVRLQAAAQRIHQPRTPHPPRAAPWQAT
jgi:hypothetical protein